MRDLDLAERGSEEATSKPGTFLQHADLTKLESVFEVQLRMANSMEAFLTAIANRLKTEELPAENKSIYNRYLLALSRTLETFARQSEVSRANIVLRRREGILSKLPHLPQEDKLRLRNAPMDKDTIFSDVLLQQAQGHARSDVQDQAIRQVVSDKKPSSAPRRSMYRNQQSSYKGKSSGRPQPSGRQPQPIAQPSTSSSSATLPQQQQQSFRHRKGRGRGRGRQN